MKKLPFLPIGETKVTDAGLKHLAKLTHLTYLGLRGNSITDKGMAQLRGLKSLDSLYLGETNITDSRRFKHAGRSSTGKIWKSGESGVAVGRVRRQME